MSRVFVTRYIPKEALDILESKCSLDVYESDEAIPRNILLEKVRDLDGLLCLLSENIDKELIDHAPNLKVISNLAVGFNNIDIEYATRKKIVVTNTPGVLTDATADFTWALLLATTRRVMEADRMCRVLKFKGWGPMVLLGYDIVGKTLGILGAGRIGMAVIERSRGWRMEVLYYDKEVNTYLEEEFNARRVNMNELLENSDFISIHLPLSDETKYLIDEEALRIMKETAILINTARGPIVNESALLNALQQKRIGGAGLDVFEHEPEITTGLTELDNVVLAPHIGSATVATRNKMAVMAADNLLAVLEGKNPNFPVNPEVFNLK